jgi:hypothetical protein
VVGGYGIGDVAGRRTEGGQEVGRCESGASEELGIGSEGAKANCERYHNMCVWIRCMSIPFNLLR